MTYEQFLKILLNYRSFSENASALYEIGLDLHEGKYSTVAQVEEMLETIIESHYGKEGVDWVVWFIYESDWGEKGEPRSGANDNDGNPICYSFESLYEYLENEIQK
jgi:hypothetical protein